MLGGSLFSPFTSAPTPVHLVASAVRASGNDLEPFLQTGAMDVLRGAFCQCIAADPVTFEFRVGT